MAYWLGEQGTILIEQPMIKDDHDANAWITEHSPVFIIADESVQRFADMEKIKGAYHGINMKLMKSGGMAEGFRMIKKAQEWDMKICGTLAGAALAPLCDWADLDGPFLTSNNPFQNPGFEAGKWLLSEEPGLGLKSSRK
jgi:L-alanine-DL-glutamate epimerase-like enolase superfamily enzyme